MPTMSRWVIPSCFTEENYKTEGLIFDLTNHLTLILKNEVWKRKFDYGFNSGLLMDTKAIEIKRAIVKVFPCFVSGYVNEKRIPEIIENVCGKIPAYLKIDSYQEWSHQNGCVIVEIEYNSETQNIPSKEDVLDGSIADYEFIDKSQQQLALIKELASFFLAGLHLSFPTRSTMVRNDTPLIDGFFQIKSGRRSYATKIATNAFMHKILIETSKKSNIDINLKGLASVWHYDLWPLKRYLKAVGSDQLSMDNLLDLVFALEGLFNKNTSSDFIKSMCMLNLCETRKDARKMKSLLDIAYRIRNNIAHGERSYDAYERVKVDGKERSAQYIYWEMKAIVAAMMVKGISKLLDNPKMKNLRFNSDDFINIAFEK